jgi:hypothetical protein
MPARGITTTGAISAKAGTACRMTASMMGQTLTLIRQCTIHVSVRADLVKIMYQTDKPTLTDGRQG